MTVTGPQLRRRRLRRARARSSSRRKPTPSLRVFVDAASESAVGANQLADVRWSAVFDDVELTAADIARLAKEARPLIRSGGRWVALDQADLAGRGRRARRTADDDAALGRARCCASRSASKARRSPAASRSTVAAGRPICSRPRPTVSAEPAGAPDGLRRRAAQLPGRGARVARLPRLGRARRLPRARHGSRQDADDARPPARRRRRRARARDRAAGGRRQLDRRGARASRPACASSCTTARTAPSADEIAAEVADADVVDHDLRHRGARRRRDRRRSRGRASILDEAQAIKNPANDTSQQLRRIPARTRVALTGTPIENGLGDLWAILDFTNPGLVGTAPAVHRRALAATATATRVEAEDAMRALNGILVFRRTKAEPEIAAELPDQIDELDHCAMTRRADRPVPGGARHAGHRRRRCPRARSRARARSSPRSPRSSRSATTRPRTRTTTVRSPGARASSRASRRSSTRCSRPARRVLVFTHFAEWGMRLAEHLTEAHRNAGRVLPRRPVAHARATSIIADFQGGEGPGALVLSLKAGGTGLEPHRREPRRALRPLVEPRGRRPGARPRVAHRPDPHRHLPPADLPGHRRRARRGGRRGQAPHRRSRAAEVELARRPRQRPAARRARHPSRRRAHRRPGADRGGARA